MPGSKLISAIEQRQKKPAKSAQDNANDDDSIKVESSGRMEDEYDDQRQEPMMAEDDDNDQMRRTFIRRREDETGSRQNKMIGLYPYNAIPFGFPTYSMPIAYPSEFYDDFEAFYGGYGEDDEIMSRTNPGNRRRPASGNFKNSPIFYIRLPPTPYMFVPGLGYISQPPSYTPMAPVPPPISPFYNLPLDFVTNGKPTNIYQWGSPATPQYNPQPQYNQQPQYNPQYVQQQPQFGAYPSYQRPQRPFNQRPINPYLQDTKVTNLKGPFLFNGRPEEIYLLQNNYNPIYSDHRYSNGFY